jgi:hypothetical protein
MQLCETSKSELETTKTTAEKSFSSVVKSNTNTKRETKSSSKSKINSIFKKQWIKDPQYARFLQECKTNPRLAYCSACKSDFSIANGETYLINRHMEQVNHKFSVELEDREKCKLYK